MQSRPSIAAIEGGLCWASLRKHMHGAELLSIHLYIVHTVAALAHYNRIYRCIDRVWC